MKYSGVGSSRWASTLHYEQQQGRRKAVPCRYLRGVKIRGAHACSVLAMAFCHRELLSNLNQHRALITRVVSSHISKSLGRFMPLLLQPRTDAALARRLGILCLTRGVIFTLRVTNSSPSASCRIICMSCFSPAQR